MFMIAYYELNFEDYDLQIIQYWKNKNDIFWKNMNILFNIDIQLIRDVSKYDNWKNSIKSFSSILTKISKSVIYVSELQLKTQNIIQHVKQQEKKKKKKKKKYSKIFNLSHNVEIFSEDSSMKYE